MDARGGMAQDAGVRPRSRWSDAAAWTGEDLHREVFFFPAGEARLFGSLYRAPSPSREAGLLICPSWGVEADRSSNLMHRLAVAAAERGGAAFVFHYPGYGDSEGDLAAATMDSLRDAAARAAAEAERRLPQLEWGFAGFTFGAAVACLAQADRGGRDLLLLQPELRPGAYFLEIARKAKRSSFGKELERLAFGYPAPAAVLDRAAEADAAVEAALAGFHGAGVAVHYDSPEPPGLLPESIERVSVPGAWRFGSRRQPGLFEGAVDGMERLWARSSAVGSGAT